MTLHVYRVTLHVSRVSCDPPPDTRPRLRLASSLTWSPLGSGIDTLQCRLLRTDPRPSRQRGVSELVPGDSSTLLIGHAAWTLGPFSELSCTFVYILGANTADHRLSVSISFIHEHEVWTNQNNMCQMMVTLTLCLAAYHSSSQHKLLLKDKV